MSDEDDDDLLGAWARARAFWAEPILLSAPADDPKTPIAHIDLCNRKVWVNLARLDELGLTPHLETILAHEVGHHLRYPGDLVTAARLALIERTLIPLPGFSAVNLFTDLLINERLGRSGMREDLTAIYVALKGARAEPPSAVFAFYLTLYEELWQLPAGLLMGDARPEFAARHPRFRAEAHIVAQDLFHLAPDLYTQFLYFLSVLAPFLEEDAEDALESLACRCSAEPSEDDWARALEPSGAEARAIERAAREGWLSPAEIEALRGRDAFERRVRGLPGQGTAAAERVPEIMAAWYRQQAARYLIEPPPQREWGEAVVPTTLEEWEPGEPLVGIDWTATLRARGDALGAAMPMRREMLADEEGFEVASWQPRMEIYLDVSGSMPDPRRQRNAMTLAAQILATGTVRAQGWVRALVYSERPVLHWTWSRSAVEISRFLMHYVGGGTRFPFGVLKDSLETSRAKPIRVVITDGDFDHDVERDPAAHRALLTEAAAHSTLVLLLHRPNHARVSGYRLLGARVIEVQELDDFPRVAADLSRALFEEDRT